MEVKAGDTPGGMSLFSYDPVEMIKIPILFHSPTVHMSRRLSNNFNLFYWVVVTYLQLDTLRYAEEPRRTDQHARHTTTAPENSKYRCHRMGLSEDLGDLLPRKHPS